MITGVTTVGTICCRKRSHRRYRVGGLDFLLWRSDLDEEDARAKLSSGARTTPR